MSAQSDSSARSLPPVPDVEQQRKLAKELLRAFRAGDADAQARVRTQLPDKPRITLADAQLTLAREYGFRSWAELRRHIESVRRANAAQTAGPDRSGPAAELVESMRRAVESGDAGGLRRLAQEHPELRSIVNERLFAFDTPALVHVAGRPDARLVEVLLELGADPNRRSSWWAGPFHALHVASDAAAQLLLAAGAEPDACGAAHLDRLDLLERLLAEDAARVHERGGDGQTPLHFARSRPVVDRLLEAGADPEAHDIDHRATPAQWMLDRRRGAGRFDLAAYLVERGATTDIFLAAALGLTERVRSLLEADPSLLELRTNNGDYGEQPPSSFHIYTWTIGQNVSPMQVAAQFEQWPTLEAMRPLARPRQRLLAALEAGDEADARALLAAQPSLLQELTDEDRRRLPEAGWNGNARAVALMLELGFDPAITSPGGATVLHNAAHEGALDCVRVVLRYPAAAAIIDRREDVYDGTALDWCIHGSAFGPKGQHAAIARLLLDAGATPSSYLDSASDDVRAVIEEHRNRRGH